MTHYFFLHPTSFLDEFVWKLTCVCSLIRNHPILVCVSVVFMECEWSEKVCVEEVMVGLAAVLFAFMVLLYNFATFFFFSSFL